MHAAHPVQPFSQYDPTMLEIALTPAPISGGKVNERRWAFFVTPRDFWHQIDFPAGAPQECGFHKVMAQYVSTKWRPSCEVWQARVRHKGFGANNGVVSPIATITQVPIGDAS